MIISHHTRINVELQKICISSRVGIFFMTVVSADKSNTSNKKCGKWTMIKVLTRKMPLIMSKKLMF